MVKRHTPVPPNFTNSKSSCIIIVLIHHPYSSESSAFICAIRTICPSANTRLATKHVSAHRSARLLTRPADPPRPSFVGIRLNISPMGSSKARSARKILSGGRSWECATMEQSQKTAPDREGEMIPQRFKAGGAPYKLRRS